MMGERSRHLRFIRNVINFEGRTHIFCHPQKLTLWTLKLKHFYLMLILCVCAYKFKYRKRVKNLFLLFYEMRLTFRKVKQGL